MDLVILFGIILQNPDKLDPNCASSTVVPISISQLHTDRVLRGLENLGNMEKSGTYI